MFLFLLLLLTSSANSEDYFKSHYQNKKCIEKVQSNSVIVSDSTGHGTGQLFKVNKRYYVFTANHVIEKRKIYVQHFEVLYKPKVVYRNKDKDIAVLKMPDSFKKSNNLEYKGASNIEIGDPIFFISSPSYFNKIMSTGTIMKVNDHGGVIIQSYGWFGSSGASIFNEKCQVVGILSGINMEATPGDKDGTLPPQFHESVIYLNKMPKEMEDIFYK